MGRSRGAAAAAVMAAALMLGACTSPSADTSAGSSSPPGSASAGAAPTPGGDPGREDPSVEATSNGSSPDVIQIENPSGAPSSNEPLAVVTPEAHSELGKGNGDPLAVGTASAGLSWSDGTQVKLDVLAVNQASQMGSAQLHTDVDDRFRGDIDGAPKNYSVYPFSDAGADGSLGRVLALAVSDELAMGSFSGPPPPSRAGYVDAKGWHGGPEVAPQSYYGGTPVWAAEGRLFWLDDGYSFTEQGAEQPWSLHSWAPGEKKATLLVSGKDHQALQSPSAGVTLNGQVYFSTYDETQASGLPSLFSVPAKGGELKLTAKNAGSPLSAGASIAFERYYGYATDDEFSFYQAPLVSSIARFSPGEGIETLLKISRAEALRGIQKFEASNEEGMGQVDALGRPLDSVALIAAGTDRVVLRQRTQLLVLDTQTHSADRLLPLVRPNSSTLPTTKAAVCSSGTAILEDTVAGSTPVVFWLPRDGSTLRWLGETTSAATPTCAGDVITLRASDLTYTDPGGLLVVRPSL